MTAGPDAAAAARESERRRIGRDLHDQVGQDLTYALLRLADLERRLPDEADAVRAATRAVRDALDHVRALSEELGPSVVEDLGLEAALTGLTLRAGSATLAAGCHLADLTGLSPAQQDVAYRVTQEAVTNVLRHADAALLEVRAERTADGVLLSITDDGRGGVRPEGSGVRGMVGRAASVGATLTVESDADGTAVRLFLALPDAPAATR